MSKEDTKAWYQSKGVVGSLIVIAIAALGTLGLTREAEEVSTSSEQLTEWILQIGTIVGGILAFIGRIKANTKITK